MQSISLRDCSVRISFSPETDEEAAFVELTIVTGTAAGEDALEALQLFMKEQGWPDVIDSSFTIQGDSLKLKIYKPIPRSRG